jgi:hypothetical protein
MHHRNEPLLRAAAAAVVSKAHEFKPQELANLVWAYASMEFRDDAMLAAVARRAHALAEQVRAAGVGRVWSTGLGPRYRRLLLPTPCSRARARLRPRPPARPQFNEQELSNLIWGLGKLHYADAALFDHLLRCVASKLHAFTPQGIANVAWGIATAGHADVPLFRRLLAKCVRELPANDVQGLANMLWASAAIGVRDDAFMAAATAECCRRVDDLSPQQLANVLWACATLGWADPRAVARLADAAAARSGGFEPQALSNCAWAFARLGAAGGVRPSVFEALAAAALPKARSLSAQGCANLLWAFASAGAPHPRLFEAVAHQVTARPEAFNAHNCSVAAWACATARHYSAPLCDAVLARVLGAPAGDASSGVGSLADAGGSSASSASAGGAPLRMEPGHAANLLWALARLGHPVAGGPFAPGLRAAAAELMPAMGRQELCNSGWALAALGLMDDATWGTFTAALTSAAGGCRALGAVQARQGCTRRGDAKPHPVVPARPCPCRLAHSSSSSPPRPAGLTAEDLQQAFHAQLLAQAARKEAARGGAASGLPDSIDDAIVSSGSMASAAASAGAPRGALVLPEPLRTVAERCWRDASAAAAASRGAGAAGEVAAALEVAGASCALGQATRDGLLVTDVALEIDGRRVAIEVGAEGDYSSNKPPRALGDAVARARLLRERGWRVVGVAPEEWAALPAEPTARAAALLKAVDEELGHTEWAAFGAPSDAPPEAVAAARDAAAAVRAAAQRREAAAAAAQAAADEQRQMEAATGELVHILLSQKAQAEAQQAAAMGYLHPVRRVSAEAGDVAAAAAAAVLSDAAAGAPWLQGGGYAVEPSMVPFVAQQHQQQQAAAAAAAAVAAAQHPGLAALLYGGGAPGGAAWAWAPAPAARDEAALLTAAPAGLRGGGARPDEVMLGFGWGSGIWGRP